MNNIFLKPLYTNRIKTLKRDISKASEYILIRSNLILEYKKLVDDGLIELKNISDDTKIVSNIKYIQLNEKTSEIEKITKRMSENSNEIDIKNSFIKNEYNILLQNCINDHPNISKIDIEETILFLLNN